MNINLSIHSALQAPNRTIAVRLVVAITVSLVTLLVLFHITQSQVESRAATGLVDVLRSTLPSALIVYGLLLVVQLFLRTYRYQLLLTATGHPNLPGMIHIGMVTAVRNMLVDLLPARLGELGFVALLNRGYRVPASVCLSALSIAIVFDFIGLLVILSGLAVWQVTSGDAFQWTLSAIAFVILLCATGLVGLFFVFPWLEQRLRSLFPTPGSGWRARILDFFSALKTAIINTRQNGRFARVLLLTICIRALKYGGLFVLFSGVTHHLLPGLHDAPIGTVVLGLIGAELGASLPIPTFMSFGSYEGFGLLTFSAFGIDAEQALMALFSTHIWSQLMDYGIGLVGWFLILIFAGKGVKNLALPKPQRKLTVAAATLACASLVTFVYWAGGIFLRTPAGASDFPPSGESVAAESSHQRDNAQRALEDINGFVVWSSNRSGNHDIWKMTLPDMVATPVTQHGHTEFYPRISPDGSKLVFARSVQPYVSQRDWVQWNVVLLDLKSGHQKVLSPQSTFPFWIDPHTVGYLRNGNSVRQMDIQDLTETVLFDATAQDGMSSQVLLSTPHYHPERKEVVFTARQHEIGLNSGTWGTARSTAQGPPVGMEKGCQVFWSEDGAFLYQVAGGGRQKTRFVRIDPNSGEQTPWFDSAGEYSHEYFPKLSSDSRILVFGASTGGHEHDTADYELFLWRVDASPDSAVRLTFHTGNDNWPDVFLN
ncbi:MAG: lysylphosphatidylglycerol synthase domain-containing protein [Pseudomonadota bacterium]